MSQPSNNNTPILPFSPSPEMMNEQEEEYCPGLKNIAKAFKSKKTEEVNNQIYHNIYI